METWRLLPLLVLATAAAAIGKRYLNTVSGIFLGGVGGVFGTLDPLCGPYGGVVGVVVGALVALLPFFPTPKSGQTQSFI